MTRPWVIIVAGACAVFTIAIAVRQFRGSDADEASGGPPRLAALSGSEIPERGGWSARQEALGSAPQGGGNKTTGSVGGTAGGGVGETSGRAGGSAAAVRGGFGGPGGSLGFSATSGPRGAANSARVSALPEASVRFEPVERDSTARAVSVRPYDPGISAEVDPEDGGPVLSLPLDGDLEPERGDSPVVAEGVSFESGDGAHFSTNSQFAVPNAGNLTGEAGTISFTLEPGWNGGDDSDASLVQLRTPNQWENRIQITKNGRFLRFLFTDDTGVESGAGAVIDNWQSGEQHTVTTTWGEDPDTGLKVAALYVDGRLAGQGTYNGQFKPPNGPMYIGSDHPGGQPSANGTISQFKAYNRQLAPTEVSGLGH